MFPDRQWVTHHNNRDLLFSIPETVSVLLSFLPSSVLAEAFLYVCVFCTCICFFASISVCFLKPRVLLRPPYKQAVYNSGTKRPVLICFVKQLFVRIEYLFNLLLFHSLHLHPTCKCEKCLWSHHLGSSNCIIILQKLFFPPNDWLNVRTARPLQNGLGAQVVHQWCVWDPLPAILGIN